MEKVSNWILRHSNSTWPHPAASPSTIPERFWSWKKIKSWRRSPLWNHSLKKISAIRDWQELKSLQRETLSWQRKQVFDRSLATVFFKIIKFWSEWTSKPLSILSVSSTVYIQQTHNIFLLQSYDFKQNLNRLDCADRYCTIFHILICYSIKQNV